MSLNWTLAASDMGMGKLFAESKVHTDMSKTSKDRLRDHALQVTMRDHATYPSSILTYL